MDQVDQVMRVYAPIEDQALEELDQAASAKGISRAQLLIKAIDFYLHHPEPSTEELDQLRSKLDQKEAEVDQQRIKLDQVGSEMDQLRIKLDQSNTEASNQKDELDQLKTKHNQSIAEATQRWEEMKGNRKEIDKLKMELEEARSANQKLKDEILGKQSDMDQLSNIKEELAVGKVEINKLLEAMKVKDDEVAFLRSHIAQLTQSISQLSLKPGEEEIKKKGWWHFW
jgi:chromosome segregation ATPase